MKKPIKDSFNSGIKILLVCHLLYLVICAIYFFVIYLLEAQGIEVVVDKGAVGIVLFIMLVAPGIVGQLFYAIPIMIYLYLVEKRKALKGVFTGVLFTGFLNIGVLLIAAYMAVLSSPDTTTSAYGKKHPITMGEKKK
ncbi:MAG: hypothetical protein HQL68_03540 [Magnetococcales bacterium]|nr:hypothetical protein [Magnetococcales bacterium]